MDEYISSELISIEVLTTLACVFGIISLGLNIYTYDNSNNIDTASIIFKSLDIVLVLVVLIINSDEIYRSFHNIGRNIWRKIVASPSGKRIKRGDRL